MDEHSQIPTIKKAVTYIIDENGNEVEQTQSAERKAQSVEEKEDTQKKQKK